MSLRGSSGFALDLLGAHVERRAHRHADLGQIGRFGLVGHAGQAEVGHLHLAGAR